DERPLLTVGFNRRFSPAAAALNTIAGARVGPLLIHYRVNAGRLPVEDWTLGPEGGGRKLGDACHFYALCRYLVGHAAVAVTAAAMQPGGSGFQRSENFTASLNYADGSLATLTYVA